ncbi:MAG TPA: alpha/beta fold hydrolase [Vicinamibacterales bacterium]
MPRKRLKHGHLMTVYCWAAPRRLRLPEPDARLFQVAAETQVLAHCYWQRDRQSSPTLLALHGLEGSSSAHYMRGLADKALRAGFNAVLLNQRNCGGTEHLGPGLYHSGLTDDAAFVIRELASRDGLDCVVAAGYSLGGNLALKLAGEHTADSLPWLAGVCAVSPVIELAACVDALERRSNFVYQWNFVRNLKARMRRKVQKYPTAFSLDPLPAIRTVREFDEAYTAPHFGFRDAADYYHRAAAMRVVDRIRIPALVVTAADDPFVPRAIFNHSALAANPNIRLVVTKHGGHCGFLGVPADEGDDGYWAERMIVEFSAEQAGVSQSPGDGRGRLRTAGPSLPPRA